LQFGEADVDPVEVGNYEAEEQQWQYSPNDFAVCKSLFVRDRVVESCDVFSTHSGSLFIVGLPKKRLLSNQTGTAILATHSQAVANQYRQVLTVLLLVTFFTFRKVELYSVQAKL